MNKIVTTKFVMLNEAKHLSQSPIRHECEQKVSNKLRDPSIALGMTNLIFNDLKLFLTRFTKVCTPSGDFCFFNFTTAVETIFSFTVINKRMILVFSFIPVRVNIINFGRT